MDVRIDNHSFTPKLFETLNLDPDSSPPLGDEMVSEINIKSAGRGLIQMNVGFRPPF